MVLEKEVLTLPSEWELDLELRELAASSDAAARCVRAVTEGVFVHPDGRSEALHDVKLSRSQLALIAHLAKFCTASLSIDVGFGMGSSATVICAARRALGQPFEHLAFDPYGLPEKRGSVVQAYLEDEFSTEFRRVWKRSEIGLALEFDARGPGVAGFVFIDGFHTFEQVLVDFYLADQLCEVGAYILFDDAHFPAIEGVVEYVRTNRPDYAVSHLPVFNTSVVKKISHQRPDWDAYKPFQVPQREGWTPDWSVKAAAADR